MKSGFKKPAAGRRTEESGICPSPRQARVSWTTMASTTAPRKQAHIAIPTGANLQGTYGDERGYFNDADTTATATKVLESVGPNSSPGCLTVSFVNPHHREFFPAGTEFLTVYDSYRTRRPTQRAWTRWPSISGYRVGMPRAPQNQRPPLRLTHDAVAI